MPTQATLITAAVEAEVAALVPMLGLKRCDGAFASSVAYRDESGARLLVLTGMGGATASGLVGAILGREAIKAVIITGFAGATDPAYAVGQVVTPIEILDGQTGQRYKPSLPCDAWRTLYTSPKLIQSPSAKRMIFEDHGAAAVDMESAPIAAQCEAHQVPWVCVRAISDTAQASLPSYLMKMTFPDGRSNVAAAALHALTHPWHIPTLMRVGRDAKKAAQSLARAVIKLV